MSNIFKKYTSGVYCMQSDNANFNHGDETTITTKYGKEIEITVWKKLFTKNNCTYYSVIRNDGFCRTEWKRRKAERAQNASDRQERMSNEYYEKSQEGKDFLVLAEPIKIGHHSEKRHRALINRNWDRMSKSVEASEKAKQYESKANELERQADKEINIDTPECLEQLESRIEHLEHQRDALKASGNYESWQLSNLGANIRRYKQRLETAIKLWDLESDAQTLTKAEVKQQEDKSKQDKVNALLEKCEVIWAFSQKRFEEQKIEGYKYASIGSGGYVPVQHMETFKQEFERI